MEKEIGLKIRFLREREGLSQKELSKILCVSLKNWEDGRCKMRLKNLVLIVNYFKVTCNYMFGLDKNEIKSKY